MTAHQDPARSGAVLATAALALTRSCAAPTGTRPRRRPSRPQRPTSRPPGLGLRQGHDRPAPPASPSTSPCCPTPRVLHTTRDGQVRLHDPDTGITSLAAQVPVYLHDEEGLQSIAIDPDFEENGWVYMYYSPLLGTPADDPATPGINEGDAPTTGTPADFAPFEGYIQLSPVQDGRRRDRPRAPRSRSCGCPATAASAATSAATSSSTPRATSTCRPATTPTRSSPAGYVPIDERPDRNPAFDAQRTAANTNDLRGKVLRITPTDGGGYTIPEGNLFAPGTDADPARDLRHGPAQPVPHRARPRDRPAVHRRLLPRRAPARPRPRPGRRRPLDRRGGARQLRLALLHQPDTAATSTTTSPPATSGEPFDCQTPRQRLGPTTPV